MIKLMILLVVAVLCLSAVGCGDDPVPADAQTPPPTPLPTPAPPTPEGQSQYTLEISTSDTDPKRYTVTWSAQVNTGGWKLTTDQVLVEDLMGQTTARVYAILEQPAPDEMVTQAIQTLTGSHDAGEQQVDQAELSIKRIRRGQTGGLPTYVVVKRTN